MQNNSTLRKIRRLTQGATIEIDQVRVRRLCRRGRAAYVVGEARDVVDAKTASELVPDLAAELCAAVRKEQEEAREFGFDTIEAFRSWQDYESRYEGMPTPQAFKDQAADDRFFAELGAY